MKAPRFSLFSTLFLCFLCLVSFLRADSSSPEKQKVLIAILARNKAHVLPKFLQCIENLDYDKKLLSLYINTNNNSDATKEILIDWLLKHGEEYASLQFESHEIPQLTTDKPHEWTEKRFKYLGEIRNKSLAKTKEFQCDYYFVVDCDNFINPSTLKDLIQKDKPIIAPLLSAIPEKGDLYSNFFCAVNEGGYWEGHPDYCKILQREMIGTFNVPVVHCCYLIQAQYVDKLTYVDGTKDYEFVIFSNSARKNHIDQYICNEKIFGTLIHFFSLSLSLQEEIERLQKEGVIPK